MKPSPMTVRRLALDECTTNVETYAPLRKGRVIGLLVLGLVGVVAAVWIVFHLFRPRKPRA